MNTIYFTLLLIHASYSIISTVEGENCQKMTQPSGEINENNEIFYELSKCWFIEVPEGSYVRIDIKGLYFPRSCSSTYVKIFVKGESENYTFCREKINSMPIIALNDVTITYYQSEFSYMYYSEDNKITLHLQFTKENLVCVQKNHVRCSANLCIHPHQVCDGVKDCANGSDEVGCEKGIMAVQGIENSRIKATNWLKNQRTEAFGWGKNTHRAITALYISKAMSFQSDDLEEELIAKQMELQTSVALLRNASDSMSVNELSMFVNALTFTCHNPRHFYGYDLVQILHDRITSAKSPVPSAYLTLCSQNWTLSDYDVKNLMTLLQKDSKYPFQLDVRALTVMALTCMRNSTENFSNIANAQNMYESTIQKFADQLSDGSFGNVYTTALVTQALIASGQEESKQWNATAAALYLMKQLDSPSVDFLTVYLTLPILSGRSLVDIKTVDCTKKTRKEGKDSDISELMDKLGGKMQIQYSLYIGDKKDVVHTMYLRMPENSSAYDVMKVAQVADSKYKFLHRDMSGELYIYEIAGITNDPEAGKFWLLYTGDHLVNGAVEHQIESPDKFILEDNEHLIMWYRTALI